MKRPSAARFLKVVETILVVLLVVFFLLGYIARYHSFSILWWTELIAVGLPYLSLFVLLSAVFVALMKRWKLLLVHAFLGILIVLRFAPYGSAGKVTENRTDSLSLMTYNVPEGWAGLTQKEQRRRLLKLVGAEKPDIIALQDVYFSSAHRRSEPPARPYFKALFDSAGYKMPVSEDEYVTYQPVVGRFALGQMRQFSLRAFPGDEPGLNVVKVPFSWEGKEGVIYNVHLRSFGRDKPWKEDNADFFSRTFWTPYWRQYRRAYELRAWEVEQVIEIIRQDPRPIIICGDFNSTVHNWAFYRLKKAFDLQDVYRIAGKGWGATYHSRYPLVRIDQVLVGPEWEVLSAHVPDAILSDHRPVTVNLRWRSPD